MTANEALIQFLICLIEGQWWCVENCGQVCKRDSECDILITYIYLTLVIY